MLAKKKFQRIADFLDVPDKDLFTFNAESPVDGKFYTIWNQADFFALTEIDHAEKSMLMPEILETDEQKQAYFKAVYDAWINRNGNYIAAQFGTLLSRYNPIENYDSKEEHSGVDLAVKTPKNWKETTEHSVSADYKETESRKPNQWKETTDFKVSQDYKETESQKPNQWNETTTHSASNDYKSTDTQKPTTWEKTTETTGADSANMVATQNKIIPFNGSDFANVSRTETGTASKIKETQSGTFATEHTMTGNTSDTKTTSGTFDTEHTQTGTRTEETATSGTFDTEHTQTGTRTEETTTSGTFDTEHTQTGTKKEEKSHSGTFEDSFEHGEVIYKHGNIGIKSVQALIQETLDLYKHDFVRKWINEFYDSCTVYI